MKTCPACHVTVEGNWKQCPLCETPLHLEEGKTRHPLDPYPRVPLQFNRKNARFLLRFLSLLGVVLIFGLELFVSHDSTRLEYLVLAIISLWSSVAIFIRKKRNIAKATVYLLFFLSAFSLYFDRLNGWTGWSLSYAIPIVCSACLVGMLIAVKVICLNVFDYILYLQLTALLGTIPSLFLFLNWTTVRWPSVVSIFLSAFLFVFFLVTQWQTIVSELKKRMDV